MERIVGGRKEGFQLALREDGAYLTVYPEEPDADVVDLSALREKIEADRPALIRTVRGAGYIMREPQ